MVKQKNKHKEAKSRMSSEMPSRANCVLSACGIRKAFGGHVVLNNVDLSLQPGEVVLLRGDNGSGKTTLLNILTGNLKPDSGSIKLAANGLNETFVFPKPFRRSLDPIDHFKPEDIARRGVGRLWQEIRLFSTQSLLDNLTVAAPRQIGEIPLWAILRRWNVRAEEARLRGEAQCILTNLGLDGRWGSSADMVSLGQAKRVAIARTVNAGAKILFFDEPLAGLDSPGISDVMELLSSLIKEHKLTMVIVEHVFNIPLVLDVVSTVWTLQNGQLKVEKPNDVRAEIKRLVGNGLNSWLQNVAKPDAEIIEQNLSGGAKLVRVIPAGSDKVGSNGDVVLEVNDLVVYRGKRLVIGTTDHKNQVRGLTFTLRRGELTVLVAPNGWGKTTLLDCIAGILPAKRGTIKLLGYPVERLSACKRRKLGLSLLQARTHVFPELTVRENLRLAGVINCPEVLAPFLRRKASTLSGGEKQKLAMTCALNNNPLDVALVDEPFSALDPAGLIAAKASFGRHLANSGLLVAVPGVHEDIPNATSAVG